MISVRNPYWNEEPWTEQMANFVSQLAELLCVFYSYLNMNTALHGCFPKINMNTALHGCFPKINMNTALHGCFPKINLQGEANTPSPGYIVSLLREMAW